MIRRLTLFLLLLCVLAGCGSAPAAEDTPSPPTETPPAIYATLRITAAKTASQPDFSDMYAFQEYERRTGIYVDWTYLPANDLAAARTRAMVSGDLPDAFYAAEWTSAEVMRYGASGDFLPIQNLLAQYAPNADRLYRTQPEVRLAMLTPDNQIYAFPRMSYTHTASHMLMIRKDWLASLERTIPSTPAELASVLKAFVALDPNGNGQADEIGFAGSFDALRTALLGAYSLGTRGLGNGFFDAEPQTGNLRFWAADSSYRELLTLLAGIYEVGALRDDAFTMSEQQRMALVYPLTSASAGLTAGFFADQSPDAYTGLGVLTGAGSDQLWAGVQPLVEQNAAFVVTRACQNVPLALAWADGWLDNGRNAESLYWGKENTHFVRDEKSGIRTFLPAWEGRHSTYESGLFLGLVMRPDYEPSRGDVQAETGLKHSFPDVVWPRFPMTQAELDIVNDIGTRINEKVESFSQAVVIGVLTMNNALWNEYRADLDALGLEQLTEVYGLALERYFANGGK